MARGVLTRGPMRLWGRCVVAALGAGFSLLTAPDASLWVESHPPVDRLREARPWGLIGGSLSRGVEPPAKVEQIMYTATATRLTLHVSATEAEEFELE